MLGGLISTNAYSQLHAPPTCGENFTLDWSSSPSGSNEYDWPDGTLSNTFSNVDDSGINISIDFTGDTSAFGNWDGQQTPKVGNSAHSSFEGIDLYNSGYSSTGITCTITFSSPIYALSFDMLHVNKTGQNGDKYTITATTVDGSTIHPTFTNSSNPSYTSNNTNGVINATSGSTSGYNAVVGVNFANANYITSVTFLWQDCDSCSQNYVHGSGLGNFSFCIPQTLDFDGVNDYIATSPFLGNKNELTMMTWIKLDNSFNGGDIMGQRNFRLLVDSNNRLKASVKTNGEPNVINTPSASAPTLQNNLWYHVAAIYNANLGTIEMFLNGESIWKRLGVNGSAIDNTNAWNSDHDFEIGRNTQFNNNYFEGAIYETRVYNKALTAKQLQRQVFQEIENNNGNVRGKIIPKDIEGLLWNDLILYYPMDIIDTGKTPDISNANRNGDLNNMRTYQERTAPLPYQTVAGGSEDWSDQNNWLYGSVWDITNKHSEYAIIKLSNNLTTNTSHKTVGFVFENNAELVVTGDNEIGNSWYLELDGSIDLQDDSQLIQGLESDLVTSSTASIKRRQEGLSNVYRYNYWSSPVGIPTATSLTNNNSNTGNTNNSAFTINMLKENNGDIQFTSSFSPPATTPATLSTRWLYTYNSGVSYYHWDAISVSENLSPGIGWSQKGPGVGTDGFQYIFEGKPNNGTILINAVDIGGPGSHGGTTKTEFLVGNPYPSAIDANQFIDDNQGVIGGAIYLWEHWAGDSHNLHEYEGGYATVNKLGKVRAYQFIGLNGATNGSQDGTKTPTQFIPVAQGFMVEVDSDGDIEFNNGQRIFKTEANGESVFFRNNNSNSKNNRTPIPVGFEFKKMKLQFKTSADLTRELVLGFNNETSDGFDYGYDARLTESAMTNDLLLPLQTEKTVIQAYSEITEDKEVDLLFIADGATTFSIKVTEFENFENQEVYLRDNFTGIYFDLTTEIAYNFTSEAGEFPDRFDIVFKPSEALSNQEFTEDHTSIVFNNTINTLYVKNLSQEAKTLFVTNMLGQTVANFNTINNTTLHNGLKINSLSTGLYLVTLTTDANQSITKKIVIK